MQSSHVLKKYKKAEELGADLLALYQAIELGLDDASMNLIKLLQMHDDKLVYLAIKSIEINTQKVILKAVAGTESTKGSTPFKLHYSACKPHLLFGKSIKEKALERTSKLEHLQACTTDTMTAEDYRKRGEYYLKKSSYNKAERDFKIAISKDNDDFIAYTLLVYMYLHNPGLIEIKKQNKSQEIALYAINLISIKIQSDDLNSNQLASLYRSRAELEVLCGKLDSAIADRLAALPLLKTASARARNLLKIAEIFTNRKQIPESVLYMIKAHNEDHTQADEVTEKLARIEATAVFDCITKLSIADQHYLLNDCLMQESVLGFFLKSNLPNQIKPFSELVQEKIDQLPALNIEDDSSSFEIIELSDSDNEINDDNKNANGIRLSRAKN